MITDGMASSTSGRVTTHGAIRAWLLPAPVVIRPCVVARHVVMIVGMLASCAAWP